MRQAPAAAAHHRDRQCATGLAGEGSKKAAAARTAPLRSSQQAVGLPSLGTGLLLWGSAIGQNQPPELARQISALRRLSSPPIAGMRQWQYGERARQTGPLSCHPRVRLTESTTATEVTHARVD
jgi:hypothetical protein